jgi:hypothetical protein
MLYDIELTTKAQIHEDFDTLLLIVQLWYNDIYIKTNNVLFNMSTAKNKIHKMDGC